MKLTAARRVWRSSRERVYSCWSATVTRASRSRAAQPVGKKFQEHDEKSSNCLRHTRGKTYLEAGGRLRLLEGVSTAEPERQRRTGGRGGDVVADSERLRRQIDLLVLWIAHRTVD